MGVFKNLSIIITGKYLMILLVYLTATGSLKAEITRAIRPVVLPNETGQQARLYQNSHALLIGISDYQNGWPDLPGVRKDMALVQEALAENGFEVTPINDPSSEGNFVKNNNRVSIFYTPLEFAY